MRVRHPRTSLWPVLVIGAVLLAIVAAAVVLAGLPRLGGQRGATPSASPAPSGASASAATSHAPSSGAGDVPEASDFAWSSAVWVPPSNAAGLPVAYSLQAGTLADESPAVDLQVPLVTRNIPDDAGRVAVFSEPVGGAVVFVADDGAFSQVRRVTLDRPESVDVMAELDEIVWAMAVEPDGSHAYLLLVDRPGAGDAGVSRLALDGSGDMTEVLPPAGEGQRNDVVLAAVSGFRAALLISPDGAHLLRRVCADPAAACVVEVVDLESGDVTRVNDYDGAFGIAGGKVFWTRAGQMGTVIGTTDVQTGDEQPLTESGGIAVVAELDGRPVVAHGFVSGDGEGSLAVADPERGVNVEILRGAGVQLHSNAVDQSLKIVGPRGWILVSSLQAGEEQLAAIRLSDSDSIGLPPVPRVMPR